MMARDRYREQAHFLSDIKIRSDSHMRRIEKLKSGKIGSDRIIPVKQAMASNLIRKMISKYSAGYPVEDLLGDYDEITGLMQDSWPRGMRKLRVGKERVADQYVIDAHVDMLWMLAVGFLLKVDETYFKRLANIIKEDNVVDLVFEFIINARLSEWPVRSETSGYQFTLYAKLKKSIKASGQDESSALIKSFLEEDWRKEQEMAGMLTAPEESSYFGRWSFESAAITCIKALDDSSYRESQYYPKDLVDYYRANHAI